MVIMKQLMRASQTLGLILLTAAMATACGGAAAPEPTATPEAIPVEAPLAGNTSQPTPTPVAATTPIPASSDVIQSSGTLNVGQPDLGTFAGHPRLARPPSLTVAGAAPIGETLWMYDADGNSGVPMLAEEWTISDDFTTWTFKLREGVQFHKGFGEMTSEDLVWSMQQWGQNDFYAKATTARNFWQNPAGHIEAPDQYTVVVRGDSPFPEYVAHDMMSSGVAGSAWVASKSQHDEVGEEAASRDPAHTGPWEMVEHRAGEFWRMSAVQNHWRQTPFFAELVFWEIPEESTRLAGFQTGHLDTFLMAFDSIPLVENVPGARLMRVSVSGQMAIQFYGQWHVGIGTPNQRPGYEPSLPWVSSNPDLNSEEWQQAVKVRKALSIAIDREAIIDSLLWGMARPIALHPWAGHEHLLASDMVWEYDPDLARQLLAEAGYPGGFRITLTPVPGGAAAVEVCEAVASMWGHIGIDVNLQRIPYETLRPGLVGRTYQGATCQQHPVSIVPVAWLNRMMNTEGVWNSGVEHPWLEEWTASTLGVVDSATREALELEIARFLYDNAVTVIGLYVPDAVWPVGPRIEEWSRHVRRFDVRHMNGFEYIQHRH